MEIDYYGKCVENLDRRQIFKIAHLLREAEKELKEFISYVENANSPSCYYDKEKRAFFCQCPPTHHLDDCEYKKLWNEFFRKGKGGDINATKNMR